MQSIHYSCCPVLLKGNQYAQSVVVFDETKSAEPDRNEILVR